MASPPETNGPSHSPFPRLARPDLLRGGLLAGFALAAGPLAASTITTPEGGLEAGWVSIPAAGGSIRAYRARPAGARKLATVLVVRRSSGCTPTSRTCAAGWPGSATWRSRPTCSRARAT